MNTKRFRFDLATADDDAQLRRRMAEDWMHGDFSVSFRREPSYFAACAVQGDSTQVIKCTDLETGQIVGMGSRSLRMAHINGTPARVGYLADLRASPRYRRGALLARGYRYLHCLHAGDPVSLYFTVILESNRAALRALVGERAGLPPYHDYGRILTPAVHLDLPKREIREPGVRIEKARREQLADVLQFARCWLSRKQFSPVYCRLQGLHEEDVFVAVRANRIVGCCAAWDQRDSRQTHIEKYSRRLAALRPLYNLAAQLAPLKRLPSPGSAIPYFYLSLVAIEENDVAIFRALLRAVYLDRRRGPWSYFVAGLHEKDPLAAAFENYRRIEAAGRLFIVHYPDGAAEFDRLDPDRVPYIEMATV